MSDEPPDQTQRLIAAWNVGNESDIIAALRAGANPDVEMDGVPLLVGAAALHREELVRAVLDAGGDVNARHPLSGLTALMFAVMSGPPEACARIRDALLQANAEVNARNSAGNTAIDMLVPLLGVDRRTALAHADSLLGRGGRCRRSTLVRLEQARRDGPER